MDEEPHKETHDDQLKPPQFTTLTVMQYDDCMNLSEDAFEEPVVCRDINNEGLDRISSTTIESNCNNPAFTPTDAPVSDIQIPENCIESAVIHDLMSDADQSNISDDIPSFPVVKKRKYTNEIIENDEEINNSNGVLGGTSKYGRVRKQKLSSDFVPLNKKLLSTLSTSSYKATSPEVLQVVCDEKTPKKRGRKPKTATSTPILSGLSTGLRSVEQSAKNSSTTCERNIKDILHLDEKQLETDCPKKQQPNEKSTVVNNDEILKISQNFSSGNATIDNEALKSSENISPIKTYSKKSDISNKDVENTIYLNVTEFNWKVGDVAWAKIGSFPYWPCIVTLEYGSSIYVKNAGKKMNRLALHVQFFGDRGRRSWVLTTSLIKYQSKNQFLHLKQMYRKDRIRIKYFIIATRFKDLWDKAVSEADSILKFSHDERITVYQSLYPVTQEVITLAVESNAMKQIGPPRKTIVKKRGRKRKFPLFDNSSKHRLVGENTNMRTIFERRMKRILPISKIFKKRGRKPKQVASGDPFNKLLDSSDGQIVKRAIRVASNSSRGTSNDLSVYDFESDEDTDVFIGTYNSKFTPQLLTDLESTDGHTTVDDLHDDTKDSSSTANVNNDSLQVDIAKPEGKRRGRKKKSLTLIKESGSLLKKKRGRPRKILFQDECATNVVKKVIATPEKTELSELEAFEDFRSHVMEKLNNDHSEWDDEEKEKLITKMWSDLEFSRKKSHWCSTYDSSSEDEEIPSQVSPANLKSWDVFANCKAAKFCEICFESGDTVKCRGPCSGYYHRKCAVKVDFLFKPKTVDLTPRRGRPRKSILVASSNVIGTNIVKSSETDKCSDNNAVNTIEESSCKITEKINSEAVPKPVLSNEVKVIKDELSIPAVGNNVDCTNINSSLVSKIEQCSNMDTVTSSNIIVQLDKAKSVPVEIFKSTDDVKNDNADKRLPSNDETAENEISSSTSLNHTQEEIVHVKQVSIESQVAVCETVTKINGDRDSTNTVTMSESKLEIIEDNVAVAFKDNFADARKTDDDFICKMCSENEFYPCFSCGEKSQLEVYACSAVPCGRVYHKQCLNVWPQATWSNSTSLTEVLKCPQHVCHTCVSENPATLKSSVINEDVVKCLKCPATYHKRLHCLPAGTEILTSSQIICPRHYEPPPLGIRHAHCNVSWCFICCSGGSLICCDECPASFHAECMKLKPEEYEGKYICEDCKCGCLLLYGDIAWVKLGHYRWWPARILFPHEVPDNLLNIPHRMGEFVVKFFGSNNFNWMNRGRAFAYQEGDSGKKSCGKSTVDVIYEKATIEAEKAFRKLIVERAAIEEERRVGLKPPPFSKIKVNKPVGNVKIRDQNSTRTPCECDPESERPCSPESNCLNRVVLVECNPSVCPARERCMNQAFEKRVYPPLMPFKTAKRGWGLKTLVDIEKGDFIIEYVGEIIDEEEYKKRIGEMQSNHEENYYFVTIDKDRMLDGRFRGNVSRFMNHSCDPNSESQKWTVNGDTRIGIFALKDIPANTELVFNYNLVETLGGIKQPCLCGAENCSGFIGVKALKNGSNSSNVRVNGNVDECMNSNVDRQCKMINGLPIKRSKRCGLPGIVTKRTISQRSTESGIRRELDEMKRRRMLLKDKLNLISENELKTVDQEEKNNADEKVGENALDDVVNNDGCSKEIENSKDQKHDCNQMDTPKKDSSMTSRNKIMGESSVKKHNKKVDGHKEKLSFMKSTTPIGKYVNQKVEDLYKSPNTYIKKSESVSEPKVEKRGRKRKPETEEALQELYYQIIKNRLDKKMQALAIPRVEDKCFICKNDGELLFCDNNECPKGYHLPCLNRESWPTGRWLCPWHYCSLCQSRNRVAKCNECIKSYCEDHSSDNIFLEPNQKSTCSNHKSDEAVQYMQSSLLAKQSSKQTVQSVGQTRVSQMNQEVKEESKIPTKIRKMMIKGRIDLVMAGEKEYIEQLIIAEKPNSVDSSNYNTDVSINKEENESRFDDRLDEMIAEAVGQSSPSPVQNASQIEHSKTLRERSPLIEEILESWEDDASDLSITQSTPVKGKMHEISDDDFTNWEVEEVLVEGDAEVAARNTHVVDLNSMKIDTDSKSGKLSECEPASIE